MNNPKDPWAPRPDDEPTRQLGPQGRSGYSGSDAAGATDDPTVAYGANPQAAPRYPSTEQFAPWTPPPVNATQQLPTAENQWGAYENGGTYEGGGAYGGYGPQWSGAPGQPGAMPPGTPPPIDPMPYEEPPRKRNTGLWIALALGVLALVAVGGIAAGVLLGDKDSDSTTAGGTTTRVVPSQGPIPTTVPRPSGSGSSPSGLPGLPGLDDLGATAGTISANSGGTLTLSTLSGQTVTVRTTDKTQVISLSGAKASDLPVGDVVMVQGDKSADGSINAKVIISTGLPGGPR